MKTSSQRITTEMVIGMSDALIVPFALAAGACTSSGNTHLTAAIGVSGSIAMGLGAFLAGLGYPHPGNLPDDISQSRNIWTDFMPDDDWNNIRSYGGRSRRKAVFTGISYAVGGCIPVLPYFFATNQTDGLTISAIVTMACLVVFGFFKIMITGWRVLADTSKLALVAAIAAAAAFIIVRLSGA